MALRATVYRFDLRIVHAEVGRENAVVLSAARHPSETIERLWLRVIAAGWLFEEGLSFGKGLSDPDAPDISVLGPDGRPTLVVRVGSPEPVRVDRDLTANREARVAVLFDSPRHLSDFLEQAEALRLGRLKRAKFAAVDPGFLRALVAHDERRMKCSLTFIEGHLYAEVDGQALDGPLTDRAASDGEGE